jgi:hypothetical protein
LDADEGDEGDASQERREERTGGGLSRERLDELSGQHSEQALDATIRCGESDFQI